MTLLIIYYIYYYIIFILYYYLQTRVTWFLLCLWFSAMSKNGLFIFPFEISTITFGLSFYWRLMASVKLDYYHPSPLLLWGEFTEWGRMPRRDHHVTEVRVQWHYSEAESRRWWIWHCNYNRGGCCKHE